DVPPPAAGQRHPSRRGASQPDGRAGPGQRPRPRGRPLRRAPHPRRGVRTPVSDTTTAGAPAAGDGTDLTRLTAVQMADAMAAGGTTSEELVRAHLDRI